jgi:hypothetical protein
MFREKPEQIQLPASHLRRTPSCDAAGRPALRVLGRRGGELRPSQPRNQFQGVRGSRRSPRWSSNRPRFSAACRAMRFARARMTACGTKLSIANVRSTAAFRGKADSICSLRAFPVVTHNGPRSTQAARGLTETSPATRHRRDGKRYFANLRSILPARYRADERGAHLTNDRPPVRNAGSWRRQTSPVAYSSKAAFARCTRLVG